MRSLLFNSASIISLLLCVGATIAWTRSTSGTEDLTLPLRWKVGPPAWNLMEVSVSWSLGTVGAHWFNSTWYSSTLMGFPPETPRVGVIAHQWRPFSTTFAGSWRGRFGVYRTAYHDNQVSSFFLSAGCPFWFFIGTSAVLPTLWLSRRLRRRQRLRRGHCQTCGYDLRASPHRCPECGVPATVAPQAR